ncbi:hypothetical protein F5Y03DRAFT_403229 [Xylaria venustula]|nr:hypothetical protein F5Y03DRAFT_403229 [Xylaria venustula]
MAILQSALHDLPYIPDNSDIDILRYNYTAPEYQKLCNSQPGELLGSLDITAPRHPVLRRPIDGDGVPLSAEGSAEGSTDSETLNTAIGDQSEHTDTAAAPPDRASNVEQAINENFQEDLSDEETQLEGHQPTANPITVQPCEGAWLDETAEPGHAEHSPMIQIGQETPTIVPTGARV